MAMPFGSRESLDDREVRLLVRGHRLEAGNGEKGDIAAWDGSPNGEKDEEKGKERTEEHGTRDLGVVSRRRRGPRPRHGDRFLSTKPCTCDQSAWDRADDSDLSPPRRPADSMAAAAGGKIYSSILCREKK